MSTRMSMVSARTPARPAIVLAAILSTASAADAAEPGHEPAPLGLPAHGMLEDPFNHSVLIDRLEAQDANGDDVQAWDATAWVGHAYDKLTIRTEGERSADSTERADLQLLWAHSVGRWWDVVVGARGDFEPGPTRGWAAFGIQGLAPYRFELEATAYLGEGGDSTARFEAEYELLITSRLILQPRVELDWYGQDDAARGIGAGLATVETGLRLRYELRREVAPYVGLIRERKFGGTEDFARAAGDDADDTRWVAGVRLRF
jgi:copper resistance protein B